MKSSVVLNYAGNYGLGDYLGPILNGYRFYHLFGEPVQVKFGWIDSDKDKINESDKENIYQQITAAYKECQKMYPEYDVEVVHKFGVKPLPGNGGDVWSGRHKSYHLTRLPFWYEELLFNDSLTLEHKSIALWLPLDNVGPIPKHKDALGRKGWEELRKLLGKEYKGYKVKEITYRDSNKYIAHVIKNSDICIGYDGLGLPFAKLFNKPMVTFLENVKETKFKARRKLPWYIRVGSINEFLKKDISWYIKRSKRKKRLVKKVWDKIHLNYKRSTESYKDVKKEYKNEIF